MVIANIIVSLLSIFSIVLLSITFFIPVESELYKLIGYFDFLLCIVFLCDFFSQLFVAKSKWKYFYTVGWLDLLSSIPIIYQFRFIRVFRIFRVLRIIKSIIDHFHKKEQSNIALWVYSIFCLYHFSAMYNRSTVYRKRRRQH